MIDYTKYRAALERIYEDRVTISRHVPFVKPNKQTVLQLQAIYMDQPCRLSQTGLGKNSQSPAQNAIQYESKLFLAPELELKQGDEIEVTRGRVTVEGWILLPGQPRTFTAGEPFLYPTHQEVSLQRKEKA
ncbi:phage protein [Paenibacillus baekrokdamisoli]|uniref:Phage protein n=1 Tax=Paenibacillus baekrokdamisoli TaxID=1712516 RepID=A0A3G9J962_9BACL|nr:ABC transporter ATP-binding protein [Paenibacillus baekrokdamisoli]MBB3070474.1 hypothetical protein [Paenibacillus baekrokdamisoli]BBH19824.1 phage protein [Paenibacillus baekrokdamisoli]